MVLPLEHDMSLTGHTPQILPLIDLCNLITNGSDLFSGVSTSLESCKKREGGGIPIDHTVLVFLKIFNNRVTKWKDDIKLVRTDCMYKFLDSNKRTFTTGVQ